jgi:hypothetical protein
MGVGSRMFPVTENKWRESDECDLTRSLLRGTRLISTQNRMCHITDAMAGQLFPIFSNHMMLSIICCSFSS